MGDKVICPDCKGTGFTDGVNRGAWSFEPTALLCPRCCSTGWIEIDKSEIKQTGGE